MTDARRDVDPAGAARRSAREREAEEGDGGTPRRAGAASGERLAVIFIAGRGRSGSTLLGRLLSCDARVAYLGESRFLWRRGFVQDTLCSCGERFQACPVWTAAVEEAFGGFGAVDWEEVELLRRRVERIRHLPRLVRGGGDGAFETDVAEYRQFMGRLFRGVSRVTGSSILVDSSHAPSHGAILAGIPGVELHTLHLVRDSRAVTYSWQKKVVRPDIHWKKAFMTRYGTVQNALAWIFENQIVRMLRPVSASFLRIRYEDLARRPERAISRIWREAGCGPADAGLLESLRGGVVDLPRGHSMGGNPMRFAGGPTEIREDAAWRNDLSWWKTVVVTALTWPLLLPYGYPLLANSGVRKAERR